MLKFEFNTGPERTCRSTSAVEGSQRLLQPQLQWSQLSIQSQNHFKDPRSQTFDSVFKPDFLNLTIPKHITI